MFLEVAVPALFLFHATTQKADVGREVRVLLVPVVVASSRWNSILQKELCELLIDRPIIIINNQSTHIYKINTILYYYHFFHHVQVHRLLPPPPCCRH